MPNSVIISKKILKFDKIISANPDKSLSIRWALMAAQAIGKSKGYNILNSEDVNNTLKSLKKLGVKLKKRKNYCEIEGVGLNGFNFKNNTEINCENSGTLARLICGILAKTNKTVILKGDASLSKRDFSRVIKPLNLLGVKIISNSKRLPLKIKGTNFLKPIEFEENIGSAQVKSCIMLAALNTPGVTKIKAAKSRNHSELMFKYLKIPIKINKSKNFDRIEIKGLTQYQSFNYNIPGDISSSSPFICLAALSKNSKILIKGVNVNPSRTGIIDILKKMNVKIIIKNKKKYNGEYVADLLVKSCKSLDAIKCEKKYNSRAIDEFPLIFLACAKAKGISYFNNLSELRQKESDRLKITSNFLKMIGIKVEEKFDSLKIYGNPKLDLNKKFIIKNYMKDHRVFMMACIAALTFGGKFEIHDKDSIKTSFPSFIKILKKIGAEIK
tara:strand:- start:3185 stop:4510 length:1326 start_codon:yes stop_codon:yes gene_type:complete